MFSFEKFEVEKDKANHFVYGSVITLLILSITGSLIIAFTLCTLVAVLKEVWDMFYGSGFDWWDILWTLLGSVVIITTFIINN